ncbi:MAG: cytochrome c [Proteobacteria bacterium]|nr:cytochrome c [Pseudomonadota bacterium]
MEEKTDSEKNAGRGRIFAIGTALTVGLCGLVLTCVPEKPEIGAGAARPQRTEADMRPAQASAPATPIGPSELRQGSTGARLYARFCAGCHGADGKAQTTMARMMTARPTNLADGPWSGPQTREAVIEIVKSGKGAMPSYGKEISSEAELGSLADHVLSLRSEKVK